MSDSAHAGRALVKRLLAYEARNGAIPDDVVAAARVVCQKMYAEMAQFIGSDGFSVLLKRSLNLARREFSFLEGVRIGDPDDRWFTGLAEKVGGLDATEVANGVAAVLGGFIDLLGTFIGYDLAVPMIHRCWPDVLGRPHAGKEGKGDG